MKMLLVVICLQYLLLSFLVAMPVRGSRGHPRSLAEQDDLLVAIPARPYRICTHQSSKPPRRRSIVRAGCTTAYPTAHHGRTRKAHRINGSDHRISRLASARIAKEWELGTPLATSAPAGVPSG